MKYSLKQLTVFDTVADTGSVSLAADKLALTQSATSMSLAQLEKNLGHTLFERKGKQMTLTHRGVWLRPKVKRLLQDAQHIEMGFEGQHKLSGEIHIGASQTPAEHLVPDLISHINHNFPEVRVSLSVKSTQAIIENVLDYQYDIGIIEGHCDDKRIHQETWCRDYLTIVASVNHDLAHCETVAFEQLQQAKWVLREHGSGTRKVFENAIHRFIPHLKVYCEYEYVSVLKSLVRNGPYLTCLPYLDVKQAVEDGLLTILNIPELNMERTLSFIWREDMSQNPLAECIREEGLRMTKDKPIVT